MRTNCPVTVLFFQGLQDLPLYARVRAGCSPFVDILLSALRLYNICCIKSRFFTICHAIWRLPFFHGPSRILSRCNAFALNGQRENNFLRTWYLVLNFFRSIIIASRIDWNVFYPLPATTGPEVFSFLTGPLRFWFIWRLCLKRVKVSQRARSLNFFLNNCPLYLKFLS